MKLQELQWSPETLKELNQLILERVENMGLQIQMKQPPLQILIGELAVVEAKLDALMHLMQDGGTTFESFDAHMKQVCIDGISIARQTRAVMTASRSPQIVRP